MKYLILTASLSVCASSVYALPTSVPQALLSQCQMLRGTTYDGTVYLIDYKHGAEKYKSVPKKVQIQFGCSMIYKSKLGLIFDEADISYETSDDSGAVYKKANSPFITCDTNSEGQTVLQVSFDSDSGKSPILTAIAPAFSSKTVDLNYYVATSAISSKNRTATFSQQTQQLNCKPYTTNYQPKIEPSTAPPPG